MAATYSLGGTFLKRPAVASAGDLIMSSGRILRKYGEATTINFALPEADGVDLQASAVDGGADCTIMKDEGTPATATNDFVDEGTTYSLALTATEMQAARIVITVIDATATKVWLDEPLYIETYGNASSQHPDFG